jgi:2-dehydro-3-deoxyphosphogluconate aldolase / (4S)-4-hydroxy-2-oxoglutarate aldolase
MTMDKLVNSSSIIITLDVDDLLFDRLQQIDSITQDAVVEINSVNPHLLETSIKQFPNICIGAGNITTLDELEECHQTGVNFMTSPGFMPEIVQTADLYNMTYLPSISTISEAMHAISIGCQNLRTLPTSIALCTMLNRYLPQLKLYPANVSIETIKRYLSLPFVAAVSILTPDSQILEDIYNCESEVLEFES